MISMENTMTEKPAEVVIPREKAVFWLDERGYWRNEAGKFRKKKIIDYFHRAIGRDDGGYYVAQDKGGVVEKVYFPYMDTALFAFDAEVAEADDAIALLLNTGKRIRVRPENLFIRNDILYAETPGDRIRFTERALMNLSKFLEDTNGGIGIRIGGGLRPIAEKSPS